MAKPKQILDKSQLNLTLKRLMFEIVENVEDFDNFAIIGLQPRGVLFSRMLKSMLENEGKIKI